MTDQNQTEVLNRLIAEGEHAKQLFENPYFNKLLDGLETAYFKAWKSEPDVGKREKLHGMVCVLEDLRLNIKQALDNATNARHRIDRADQLREAESKSGPLA